MFPSAGATHTPLAAFMAAPVPHGASAAALLLCQEARLSQMPRPDGNIAVVTVVGAMPTHNATRTVIKVALVRQLQQLQKRLF